MNLSKARTSILERLSVFFVSLPLYWTAKVIMADSGTDITRRQTSISSAGSTRATSDPLAFQTSLNLQQPLIHGTSSRCLLSTNQQTTPPMARPHRDPSLTLQKRPCFSPSLPYLTTPPPVQLKLRTKIHPLYFRNPEIFLPTRPGAFSMIGATSIRITPSPLGARSSPHRSSMLPLRPPTRHILSLLRNLKRRF